MANLIYPKMAAETLPFPINGKYYLTGSWEPLLAFHDATPITSPIPASKPFFFEERVWQVFFDVFYLKKNRAVKTWYEPDITKEGPPWGGQSEPTISFQQIGTLTPNGPYPDLNVWSVPSLGAYLEYSEYADFILQFPSIPSPVFPDRYSLISQTNETYWEYNRGIWVTIVTETYESDFFLFAYSDLWWANRLPAIPIIGSSMTNMIAELLLMGIMFLGGASPVRYQRKRKS